MGNVSPRIVIGGGGTGGHVLPALAVHEELKRLDRLGDILWIGGSTGVEREAATGAGIPFRAIPTGKLRRYLSPHTVLDAARIPVGVVAAWSILRDFRPDVVLSTGGFVSVPTVIAAARQAPILTHEQTAIVGLANRINARFADVFAVSYESTVSAASAIHKRVIVTGNPVRHSIQRGDAARARQRWGFRDDLPLVYVTGGARGASPLNQRVASLLPAMLDHCQILHQSGPSSINGDAARLEAKRRDWSPDIQSRYRVVEFIGDELADVYASASLVVGRAGAGTVAELAVLGKPSILIPLPGAGGDEQTRNARILHDVGGAILLPQDDATPERLRSLIRQLLRDPASLQAMGQRARGVAHRDAAGRLVDALLALALEPKPARRHRA